MIAAFDLDGTLVDSLQDITTALNEVLVGLDHAPYPIDAVRTMIGGGVRVLLERALGADDPRRSEAFRRFPAIYHEHLLDSTVLFPGVADMLHRLSSLGISIAIATNKPKAYTERVAAALDLDGYAIASADEVPVKKPDPAVIALARARCSNPSAAVGYVGDMPVDVHAARGMGCPVAGVLWGFDPVGVQAADPDVCVSEPGALVDWFSQMGEKMD